jgi:hypothetical protein
MAVQCKITTPDCSNRSGILFKLYCDLIGVSWRLVPFFLLTVRSLTCLRAVNSPSTVIYGLIKRGKARFQWIKVALWTILRLGGACPRKAGAALFACSLVWSRLSRDQTRATAAIAHAAARPHGILSFIKDFIFSIVFFRILQTK